MYFNSALLTTTFLGYIEKENWTEGKKNIRDLSVLSIYSVSQANLSVSSHSVPTVVLY